MKNKTLKTVVLSLFFIAFLFLMKSLYNFEGAVLIGLGFMMALITIESK